MAAVTRRGCRGLLMVSCDASEKRDRDVHRGLVLDAPERVAGFCDVRNRCARRIVSSLRLQAFFFAQCPALGLRLLCRLQQGTYEKLCCGSRSGSECLMSWRCLMGPANCAWSLGGSLMQRRAAWKNGGGTKEETRLTGCCRAGAGCTKSDTHRYALWSPAAGRCSKLQDNVRVLRTRGSRQRLVPVLMPSKRLATDGKACCCDENVDVGIRQTRRLGWWFVDIRLRSPPREANSPPDPCSSE